MASSSVQFAIKGVLAPVFTPTQDSGDVNLDIIPAYAEYLYSENVRGILVGGTTGEAALLNVAERKMLLEAWVRAARPLGMKVISQVGGAPLPDVLELAKFSESVQADAVMTLPELYYKPRSVSQLVSYLALVSAAAPSLPLVYYHFPMMSGVDLNMKEFFSSAKARIPNFRGMKADLGVALQLADVLEEDNVVFMANHHLATAALMGFESSIATVTNIFPSLVHGIVDMVRNNGDTLAARQMQKEMNRLVEGIASQGEFVPSMKAAMEIVTGLKVGPPRRPLQRLDASQTSRIEELLKNYRIPTFK